MKKLLLLCAALCGFTGSSLFAQEVVSTGIVQQVGKDGSLVVHSDQTNGPVTFYGVAATNIFTVDGSPATLADLNMGTKVTVQYATREGKWYVSKIMFGNASGSASKAGAAPMPQSMPPMMKVESPQGNTGASNTNTGHVSPVLTNRQP